MGSHLKEKLTIKQHLQNIKQILAVIWKMDRMYFPASCAAIFISTAAAYMELLLSAWVLDALSAKTAAAPAATVVFMAVICVFVLRAASAGMKNQLDVRRDSMFRYYDSMVEEKILSMDFTRIDSPDVRELKERIMMDNNWGAGLYSIFWQFDDILNSIFRLLGAVLVGMGALYGVIHAKSAAAWILVLVPAVYGMAAFGMKIKMHFLKKEQDFIFHTMTEEEKKEELNFSWRFAAEDGYAYQNGKDIRIYDGYNLMKHWTVDKRSVPSYCKRIKAAAIGAGGGGLCNGFIHGGIEGGAYLTAAAAAFLGAMSIGNMVRFAGCLKNLLLEPVQLAGHISEFALSARRQASTLQMLALENEMYKGKLPVEKRSDNEYQIEFKDVSFKYPGTERYALRHFSIQLQIGEKLAVVGTNGSGKTTMVKLLCRLYDSQEGEILLNGVDIRKFKQEEYSRLFSVVFQDYVLFSLMLAQNVAAGTDYDADKVRSCLKDAGFADRLAALENGIETYLYKDYDSSGAEISGGEAQKAALARAVYKEAPFILLDEPAAALDPLAEYEIYANFDKMIGTKTAVYISHRLSSCRFCKKIAVFHEGRLVQSGSHEELVADTQGKYYEMWTAQAQYYQEGAGCV